MLYLLHMTCFELLEPCVYSYVCLYSLVMIERIYILCLIIIIKSEVWTSTHCLGLFHETMVSAVHVFIAGTLGCVFIDNETHESGVTKCTTGEAWSAFSWHHSSVFHCQWTHNQVFLLLSHMLIKNAKSIFIYVMKYVSGFIWKLGINFALFIKWIDETWWNNLLLLVPNCYEVVAMVATMVAMVAPLWCHTLR